MTVSDCQPLFRIDDGSLRYIMSVPFERGRAGGL